LAILGRVFHAGRLQFDCYSPFPFQFHIVKELILHIPDSHCARFLQETVGQGRFAVINVGDYTEVADPRGGNIGHAGSGFCSALLRS
jgi:hypothetical protein